MHPTRPSPTPPCIPAATAAPRRRPVPRPRPASRGGWHGAAALIGACLLTTTLATAAPASIFMLDVLSAGDNFSSASDVNRHGHVVGASGVVDNGYQRFNASFWAGGTSAGQALPGLPGIGGNSWARGINDSNAVVGGHAGNAVQWQANAGLVYDPATSLGSLGNGNHSASQINNAGTIAGSFWKCQNAGCSTGNDRSWRLDGNGMQQIGQDSGFWTRIHALNNHGDALVINTTVDNGRITSIVAADGTVTDVPLPGLLSNTSADFGMNDGRQIVGSRLIVQGSASWESFIYSNGVEYALQALDPTRGAQAYAINNPGWVVGQSRLGSLDYAATFWAGGLVWNLNDLLSAQDAALWDLTEAVAISDNGWIAGNGLYKLGDDWVRRGFSLRLNADFISGLPPLFDGGGEPPGGGNPVPVPGTLALAGLASLALAATRRRLRPQ